VVRRVFRNKSSLLSIDGRAPLIGHQDGMSLRALPAPLSHSRHGPALRHRRQLPGRVRPPIHVPQSCGLNASGWAHSLQYTSVQAPRSMTPPALRGAGRRPAAKLGCLLRLAAAAQGAQDWDPRARTSAHAPLTSGTRISARAQPRHWSRHPGALLPYLSGRTESTAVAAGSHGGAVSLCSLVYGLCNVAP